MKLDVFFHKPNGRVYWVVMEALVSLRDEGSKNLWERVAVILNVHFEGFSVVEDPPEDFSSPTEQGVGCYE